MYRERRVVYRVLVEKPEVKRPLGKPSHRWEYKIKTDSKLVKLFPALY
jgi:hydroxyacyl-ACP dehydratase HTD2-like protein with hotdog domain